MTRLAAISACLLLAACDAMGSSRISKQVIFRAQDNNAQPVPGVAIRLNGKFLGNSDANGELKAQVMGVEGTSFSIAAKCPELYHSPEGIPHLMLNAFSPLSQKSASLVIAVPCERPKREIGILVRALVKPRPALQRSSRRSRTTKVQPPRPLADLPIVYRGKTLGHTDTNGLMHLDLSAHPGERVELLADTQGEKFQNLRPRSPTLTIEVTNEDNIFVIEPTFNDDIPSPAATHHRPKHFIKFYAGGTAPFVELSHNSKPARRR